MDATLLDNLKAAAGPSGWLEDAADKVLPKVAF